MVEITYTRHHHRLTASGHAGGGKPGEDLVCAAVSALVLTLSANVTELAIAGKLRRHLLRLEEGNTWIGCVSEPKLEPVVTMIFDSLCSGFELLQTLYPDHIRYRVIA